MLSEQDRRTLREIELQLERDTTLATTMQRQARAERWARRRHDLTVVVAGVLATVCLFLPGAAGAGLMAAVVGIVAYLVRRWRFAGQPGPAPAEQIGDGVSGQRPTG
ncbi:DUF3040 domain-containing protein [Pseudonocardia sp. GCM10023141]|uniref:DUF3040 domain-containing protein n=1 Tax=Pseudonocardia sp. GCM10023141 TaxID=3252653 RepID=UPI00361639C1